MRNALAHVSKAHHGMVSAAIRSVFAQEDQAAASKTWRQVADQLRARFSRLADLLDAAEADVLAFMAFPRAHWPKLHSTNPIERLNKEVNRPHSRLGWRTPAEFTETFPRRGPALRKADGFAPAHNIRHTETGNSNRPSELKAG
ncbi:hypothetical protein M2323_004591 [Rhodoblastus acidophilus]|nr:hypothetical protein [Rhodoblastus acidophilus]MCW2335639.1 hypothetical protein [Rhodoblastus acidophilus]